MRDVCRASLTVALLCTRFTAWHSAAMFAESVDRFRSLALLSHAQLCEALETSLDLSTPALSYGRDDLPLDSNAEAAAYRQADVDTAAEAQASSLRQLDSISGLLTAAGQDMHALSAVSVDDDELSAMRLIPRATLELMLLKALDLNRRRHGGNDYSVSLGEDLGEAFGALVSATKLRRTLVAPHDGRRETSDGQRSKDVAVRRSGHLVHIDPRAVRRGDVLLFGHGDNAPTDCILLSVPAPSVCVSIRVCELTGSSTALPRGSLFGGGHRECALLGSMCAVPQGALIDVGGKDRSARICVVATADYAAGSASVLRAVVPAGVRMSEPTHMLSLRQLPFFASPHPHALQHDRGALLRLACANVVFCDTALLLEDDSRMRVDSMVWGDEEVFTPTPSDAWNFCDPVHERASSRMAASASSIVDSSVTDSQAYRAPEPFAWSSFIVPYAANASRVAVMTAAEGLRRLMIGGLLATWDRPRQDDPFGSVFSALTAVKTFVTSVPQCAQLVEGFVPETAAVSVSLNSAAPLQSRLFRYAKNTNTAANADRRLLVVWGDAATIAKLCAHASDRKGHTACGSRHTSTIYAVSSREASAEQLVGIAIADIAASKIGSRLGTDFSPSAILASESPNLTYLGSFVARPAIRHEFVTGVDALRSKLRMSVCLVARERRFDRISALLERSGLHDAVIVDNRSVTAGEVFEPESATLAIYTGAAGDPRTDLPELIRAASAGNTRGVAYLSSNLSSAAAAVAAHVSVVCPSPNAPHMVAGDITLRDRDFGSLIAALVDARRHISVNS